MVRGPVHLTTARALCQQFSMQMDLIRQQLEFEAQHIRSLMEERFGTSDEMVQRAQVRGVPTGASGSGGRANREESAAGRRIRRWSQRWEESRLGAGSVRGRGSQTNALTSGSLDPGFAPGAD